MQKLNETHEILSMCVYNMKWCAVDNAKKNSRLLFKTIRLTLLNLYALLDH